MDVLKTDNFVSERIKIRPVTNSELDDLNGKNNQPNFMEEQAYVDMKKQKDDMLNSIHDLYIQLKNKVLPELDKNSAHFYSDCFTLMDAFRQMQLYIDHDDRKVRDEVCDDAYNDMKIQKPLFDENYKKLTDTINLLSDIAKQLDDLLHNQFVKDMNDVTTEIINEYPIWQKR